MRTVGRCLVVGWLLAALVVLGMDGRLPAFLAWATLGSLLVLGADALVRWRRRPSGYCRPRLPERYRVADDLAEPLAVVVAVAEREAIQTAARGSRLVLSALSTPAVPATGYGRHTAKMA